MFPELHAVERVCTRTPGSLKRIVLIDPDDLSYQPDWYLAPTIDDLVFLGGKAAYIFQDDRLTGRLEDTTEDAPPGDFFQYTLTARLRTVRAEVELLRAKIVNRPLHVVATYYDNTQRYLPNMRLRARADSADRPGGRNGYQFTGVCRMLRPAPFVGADISVIGGPYVPPALVEPSDVNMVEVEVTDSGYNYEVPAGYWLVGWEVVGDTDQDVSLGTSGGGNELGGPITLTAGQTWVGQGNMLPTFTAVTISFSGLEGTNTIRLWLLG